jgi:ketosteroid isomerase-like protein
VSNPEDVAKIRAWFARLAEHVRAVDFAGAQPIFAPDLVAFGTYSDFVEGRDAVEAAQWRNVWPFISGFAWRLDGVKALIAADRLSAVGMAIFDSTGYREDGTEYDRSGRATVAFGRDRIGADWIARHTHMSLFRGVPDRSFGRRA